MHPHNGKGGVSRAKWLLQHLPSERSRTASLRVCCWRKPFLWSTCANGPAIRADPGCYYSARWFGLSAPLRRKWVASLKEYIYIDVRKLCLRWRGERIRKLRSVHAAADRQVTGNTRVVPTSGPILSSRVDLKCPPWFGSLKNCEFVAEPVHAEQQPSELGVAHSESIDFFLLLAREVPWKCYFRGWSIHPINKYHCVLMFTNLKFQKPGHSRQFLPFFSLSFLLRATFPIPQKEKKIHC